MLPDPVKKLFDTIRKRPRWFLAGWLAVMLAVFAWRLASGPIRVDGLKPILISRLEAQLPGTRAAIGHLDLVWFGDARAVGLRFESLTIRDGEDRVVARAGRVETALAADSLILAHFAPARLTATDFFLVASVSEQGRYQLGFDARGDPAKASLGLDRFLFDLTGPEKLGRPASYTRQLHLADGELRLIQKGTPLDWSARVKTLHFTKLKGRLTARADLTVTGAGGEAGVQGEATGLSGLKQAAISVRVRNLVPARIFPSVGITRHLAVVDAPLQGVARIDYSFDKGFNGAYADIEAGAGHIDFGDNRQVFDGARIQATYRSADRTAQFDTFRLRSHLLDTDLSGKVVITPASTAVRRDLRIVFDFSGPRLTGRLAGDFGRQSLADARIRGAYLPMQRRLEIESTTGQLNGAPFQAQGVVYTDAEGRLGADLTASIKGSFGKDEVFAFWPENLSPKTRRELVRRIQGGTYTNADFVMKTPPGHFEKGQMQDEDLRLEFDFTDLGLMIDPRMAHATGLSGHGTLLGNSFHMEVDSGRLLDVALAEGGLNVPDFHDRTTKTAIWLEAEGTAAAAIAAVDPLAGGELAEAGLTAERLSGNARVRVDITFPTFGDIEKNLDLRFNGKVTEAALSQAALGWDLGRGDLSVSGDLLADRIEVAGPAQVGPYSGEVVYRTHFRDRAQTVEFAGALNAAQFGGSPRVPVGIKGQFAMVDGKGQGTVEADIFRGTVNWEGEGRRPSLVEIAGVTLSRGMEGQGLPVFKRLERELPTRITLLRSGEIWAGEADAGALSGDIAYIEGELPRLVYKSVITPQEARQLGYGGLPVFSEARNLTVNIALDEESREARLKLDDMNAVLGWSEAPGGDLLRRMTMTLRPEDWYTMGLPPAFFRPEAPAEVTALWRQTEAGLSGEVRLLGQAVQFNMPSDAFEAPDDPYTLRVRGQVTDKALAVLGYSHDPLTFDGTAGFVVSLYDEPGRPAGIVRLDAAQAHLGVRETSWSKPAGEAAHLALSIDERSEDGGGIDLSRIVAGGERLRIDGRAAFNNEGGLEFADFPDFYMKDLIDASYSIYTTGPSDVVSVRGRMLDLRPWLKRNGAVRAGKPTATATGAKAAKPPSSSRPAHLVVALDQVRMSDDGIFRDLSLDLVWDGASAIGGRGAVETFDGSPVLLTADAQTGYSLFSVTIQDLGSVVRTATGARNLSGGEAVIEGAYMNGQIDATLKGEDLRVKQIPVMAQLLTVASLQGAADTLTGEGIAFSDFEFPVRWHSGRLFIDDGWAEGEAMGFSVRGTADMNTRALALKGTLIPAYRINALFGDLGSDGLGLLGLKYGLGGSYDAPAVMVDPLSVMMPGFLKVWERDQTEVDAIAALKLPPVRERLAQMREEGRARLKNGG